MSHVPYASAIENLMYAMVCTIPKIAHAMGVLQMFMSKLGNERWTILKRVFRYMCDTSDYGLCYQERLGLDKVLEICGLFYANWVGDMEERRYPIGYVFNLFWRSNQLHEQDIVCSGTFNYEKRIHGNLSCKEARILVTKIVFMYGIGKASYKDIL